MGRMTVAWIAVAALVVGCAGTIAPTPTPAAIPTATAAPETAAATVAAPPATASPAALASPIVGMWVGRHECQGIADALGAAGFDTAVILENIVGNGLVPGVTDPNTLADVAAACAAAQPLRHSHEFTPTGRFFSYDQVGREVDSGPYRLVDANTVVIGDGQGVTFDFTVEGAQLTLTPQGLPAGCLEFYCQWAIMVSMPWTTMERAPG